MQVADEEAVTIQDLRVHQDDGVELRRRCGDLPNDFGVGERRGPRPS